MAFKFLWNEKKEGDKKEGEGEDKLPPELESRFKNMEDGLAKVSSIEDKLKSLDSITAYFEEQKKEKEEAVKKAKEAAIKKDELTNEELLEAFAANPRGVIKELTKDKDDAILLVRADQVKKNVFLDRAEEFPYYAGEIKKEVDKILSEQSLKFQNDSKAVENTYYTVVGKMNKEISEGKIKSRFASASAAKGTEDLAKESREKVEITITPDIEKAARYSGMSVDKYVELIRKEEGIEIV